MSHYKITKKFETVCTFEVDSNCFGESLNAFIKDITKGQIDCLIKDEHYQQSKDFLIYLACHDSTLCVYKVYKRAINIQKQKAPEFLKNMNPRLNTF